MGETTPRRWGLLVASSATQPEYYMCPSMRPIDGPYSSRLAVVWGSRFPQAGSVELQAGVLLLGPLVGPRWSRTRVLNL